jgi:hypothetical protein
MKTVKIYYAGIPAKNTKAEKRQVLQNFHLGVTDGKSEEIETADWQPSDLAVIQGWVHETSQKSPHLQFRQLVINNQKRIGKHTLAIDSNLFLYKDPQNTKQYLRFSLDGVFPTTGNYFTDHIDPTRWQQIKQDLNIDLKPWKNNGSNILVCLQRNGGWSMDGLDVMDWLTQTIKTIKQHTDRRIVVRAHPGDKRVKQYLTINEDNVKISKNTDIQTDLSKAWATITYNSSPGVASAIEGVPVFVTDPQPQKSQAHSVCNTDLSKIEDPNRPDREDWIESLAMSHYNFDDLKTGVAWNIIKEYL